MFSIGIDLGTTNSVASYFDGEKATLIPNCDGLPLTPSVVSYGKDPSGKEQFWAGTPAVNLAAQSPLNTIYSIKRLMGLNYDDPKIQAVVRRVPYKIREEADSGNIGAKVVVNGKLYSPVQISAMILRHVKDNCQQRLRRPVDAATITVPAYFLDSQRNATKDAATEAGLQLHPLLDEPIAAALSFGFGREEKERLLVYDMGGGTFDVSLIQMAGDNLQVVSKRGNMWLGGDDFDQVIIARFMDWLRARYRIESIDDPEGLFWLKHHAERAKKVLSDKPTAIVREPRLMSLQDGKIVVLDVEVARSDFEAGIKPMVEESLALVREVLDEAVVLPRQLSGVLLVGGSTHVPLVRQMLAAQFGAEKLRYDIDPMTCVSLGAAIWCQRFPFEPSGKISLSNYARTGIPIPMDLGVEVYCDGNRHHFESIIRRNTTYPTPKGAYSREFFPTADNQNLIRVPIFQGNAKNTPLNSYQGLIEETLPRGIPQRTTIMISFEIDEHGNLSGAVDFKGFPELRRPWSIRRNQALLAEDEQVRLKNWKPDAERTLAAAAVFCEKYGKFMTAEQLAQLTALLGPLRAALAGNDRLECQSLRRSLELFIIGSGTASVLYLAARAKDLAGATGVATEIARNVAMLEKAHEKLATTEIKQLTEKLKLAIHTVFNAQSSTGPIGPAPGQVTPNSH